jgi:pyruvate-formate lyase
MNERLERLHRRVMDREHRSYRRDSLPDLEAEIKPDQLSWMQLAAKICWVTCNLEQSVIFDDERIVFTRTVPSVLPFYSEEIKKRAGQGTTLHELGPISNICADWGSVLRDGLKRRRQKACSTRERLAGNRQSVEFLDCAIETIDAVLDLADRYAAAAEAVGKPELAAMLRRVPAGSAGTFHEALQALRLLQAVVWMSGNYHVGLGRFDQYMWPYLKSDLENGRLEMQEAQELLAEFFITLNKDSDLYPGVQQGDNGQTLTVGGITRDGRDGNNELTRMVLQAALEVSMIDPKINLRISAQTDLVLLSLATELTRKGLGFPQYSNDDVVVPALAANGYALEDARDYTVAACWEFIIPGKGMEVVNIGAVSLPHAVDQAIRWGLQGESGFEKIEQRVKEEILSQVLNLVEPYRRLFLPPAPFYSVLMDGCLEAGRDLSAGLKYNNYGIHGAGSANAADALAAVKRYVFEGKSILPADLIQALDSDFAHSEDLRRKLHEQGPKVACNSELADACESVRDNGRGGIIRPGTGSAMYYLWLARGHEGMREPVVGATADGRRRGDPFSANLSPSPQVQTDGLFSLLMSYSKLDYQRVYNGGPITIELSDTVFRDEESLRKMAMLVRTFAQLGCQQLQLNSLNASILHEARLHPELHRNLIVRVWGWSGHFCELAPEYQEHIIQRTLYGG